MLRIGLCGDIGIEVGGRRLPAKLLAGRQGRLAFAVLVAERHRSVSREELADVLWGDALPSSWTVSLSAIISKLRRALTEAGLDGAAALPSAFGSYRLHLPDDAWVDVEAAERAEPREALEIASRGFPIDDCAWGQQFNTRLRELRVRALSVLAASDGPDAVAAAQEAVELEPFREEGYRLLMRAYSAAGERGEALRTWERLRALLAEELGTDPSAETEAVYLDVLRAAEAAQLPTGVVTFLLTDIEGSSERWELEPQAMADTLEAHDRRITDTVVRFGGLTIKSKGEGDATLSVFRRASGAAAAALELRDAFADDDLRVRIALHTGEAFERDGDYFGPAVNRAARLRSLAHGGQVLASQATAELLRDQGMPMRDLGVHELRGLSRAEHVFELGVALADDGTDAATDRPAVPAALAGAGPFVGRDDELKKLAEDWRRAERGLPRAVLIAGEPGVGKTRLAGECARVAHGDGAIVLYGRCDEDLAAPYQPFAQAARTLVDFLGASRLRAVSGVEELTRLVPDIASLLPGLPPATHGEPEQERYVLFDAFARLLVATSAETPVLLVLDDVHWAAKPTLLLLRHVLRFASQARLLIVATYRDTELDRTHPLSAVLADLHRDGAVERVTLSGLDVDDVAVYVAAAGHDDVRLPPALQTVTSGNPFFMIEVLRHIEESGGEWDPRTLPQGVKEATGRRLSRLSAEANEALLAGAVAGASFSVELVERVTERDCVEAVDEARHAGLVVEEAGALGAYRFAHAIVRQVLLSEVASVKRVRLHLKIAAALEASEADDAELAHHYFECAWAGHAAKAAWYCGRAANRAMERLAYEEAAELFDKALQAMDVSPSDFADEDRAELLLTRCEAALAAGDVAVATASVEALERVASRAKRLQAWATCFAGQLAVLVHPDRLHDTERSVAAAASELAALGDQSGAAKAHTVHASCLFRLGRVAECESSLDLALTAARAANDHRRVNAVLAGAPVAALWGPSPVPRAGGRCLDIVRLLRITTGSPAVEAVSTRCQAVLEAFRGRADAARRMLDIARTSLAELGHRHGLFEVELFAGIVELIADSGDAGPHLRAAYDGFGQLGVDVDAALAAALLARAAGGQSSAALVDEAERLGGSDLKTAIAWRAARASLLAADGSFDEARRLAEEAVALAERTDALVDHGDACMALASVHRASGNVAAARAAAEKASSLYERKGAIALVERARAFAGAADAPVAAPASTTPPPRGAVPDNACSRVLARVIDAQLRRDFDAIRDLMGDADIDDRRRMFRSAITLRAEALIDSLRETMDTGVTRVDAMLVATRGERLALNRIIMRGAGPQAFEAEVLALHRLNAEGHLDLAIFFDADDLDAAFKELDAQFRAVEAPQHLEVLDVVWSSMKAREDVPIVDHRGASFGATTSAELIASLRGSLSGFSWRTLAIPALGPQGVVLLLASEAVTQDGVEIEWTVANVYHVHGAELTKIEIFDAGALDTALARFAALGGPRIENACTRVVDRYLTGDFVDAFTPDAVLDDRRRVLGGLEHHRALDARLQSLGEMGVRWNRSSVVATRGERLALFHSVLGGEDPSGGAFEIEALRVHKLSEDGRIDLTILFDSDDTAAAFAELNEQFIASGAGGFADVWRTLVNEGPLQDVRFVDHRQIPFPPHDEATRRAIMSELVPDHEQRAVEIIALAAHGAVLRIHAWGTTPEGAEVEWGVVDIVEVRDGAVCGLEMFAEDALDAALARFDALGRPRLRLENACTGVLGRVGDALRDGDPDRAAEYYAPDYVIEDRRAIIGGARILGAENRSLRSREELAAMRPEGHAIAIRGDKLSLSHVHLPDGDSFENDRLVVHRLNDDGRIDLAVLFDSEDVDAAFDELNERYIAGEAAPFADVWRAIVVAPRKSWPNATYVDHRPVAFPPVSSPQDHQARIESARALVPGFQVRIVEVLALGAQGAVARTRSGGRTTEGGDVEWEHISVFGVRGGLVTSIDVFPEEAVDPALARFEALGRPALRLENAATRGAEIQGRLAREQRWDEIDELFSPSFTFENGSQPANAPPVRDKDTYFEMMRAGRDVWGGVAVEFEVLAIRGERLSLIRFVYARQDDPQSFSAEWLALKELDEAGLVKAYVFFLPEDIDAALAALNARYRAGEAAPFADVLDAIAERADDLPIVDHRAASFGETSMAELVAAARDVLSEQSRWRGLAVHAIARHGVVVSMRSTGLTRHGAEIEWTVVNLIYVHDGVATRIELYDPEQLDAALARFEALGKEATLENAVTRGAETARRRLIIERNWGAVADGLADDFTSEVRFSGGLRLFPRLLDKTSYVANLPAFADMWGLRARSVVATRGDRLALQRYTFIAADDDGPGAPRIDALQLVEYDARGLAKAFVWFPAIDPDAAFAELDARFLAGEAAPYADVWRILTARGTAGSAEFVDHRTASFTHSPYGHAGMAALDELVPERMRRFVAVHALDAHGVVARVHATGKTPDGAEVEWRVIVVLQVRGGAAARLELYDEDALDAALARFATLGAPRLENAATRVVTQARAAVRSRDATPSHLIAPDAVVDDRRKVIGTARGSGPLRRLLPLSDLPIGYESTWLATRGERLCLSRIRFIESESFENENLAIHRLDDDGRVDLYVILDAEDIDAAFKELNAQYTAGEGAPFVDVFAAIRDTLAEDTPMVDHRPASFGDTSTAQLQAAARQVPLSEQSEWRTLAIHAVASHGAVVQVRSTGVTPEGSEIEWNHLNLFHVRAGVCTQIEIYDGADLDAALARFEWLRAPALENAATRMGERCVRLLGAQRWDEYADLLAPTFVLEDRRTPQVTQVTVDGKAYMAGLREGRAIWGRREFRWTWLATRGDRLALQHGTATRAEDDDPSAFATELIVLRELDAEGRVKAHVFFNPEHLDAAFEELDARYLAGEAAPFAEVWRIAGTLMTPDDSAHVLAEDVQTVDHRLASLPGLNSAAEALTAIDELRKQLRSGDVRIVADHALAHHGAVVQVLAQGTSHEGVEIERGYINVRIVKSGRITRIEAFPEDDVDAALERFAALGHESSLENAATRLCAAGLDLYRARDWEAVMEMLAPDFTSVNRETMPMFTPVQDRATYVAETASMGDIWTHVRYSVLATRGDRLALVSVHETTADAGAGAPEWSVLCVCEVGEDGSCRALVWLSDAELDGAFAELDARYLAGEGAPYADTWRVVTGEDRETVFAPDARAIDHRPASLPPMDSAREIFAAIDAFLGQMRDVDHRYVAVHAIDHRGAVVRQLWRGTSNDGTAVERSYVSVRRVHGGRITLLEVFPDDALDAALRRFAEEDRARLENACTRVGDRMVSLVVERRWDELLEMVRPDFVAENRTPFSIQPRRADRAAWLAKLAASGELGASGIEHEVLATRGDRLALWRTTALFADGSPGAPVGESTMIRELDAYGLVASIVYFDPDDLDAAFAELDARYLAGEAAPFADVWRVGGAFCMPWERPDLIAPDLTLAGHRKMEYPAATSAAQAIAGTKELAARYSQRDARIVAVHAIDAHGVVVQILGREADPDAPAIEYGVISVREVRNGLVTRIDIFDDEDLESALEFFEASRRAPTLENASTRAVTRMLDAYRSGDGESIRRVWSPEAHMDDRRAVLGQARMVFAPLRPLRSGDELRTVRPEIDVLAIRGDTLNLSRVRYPDEAFDNDSVVLHRIDVEGRLDVVIIFEPDDVEAAWAELDDYYLAGEAAPFADVWRVAGYQNPAETDVLAPDLEFVDHRKIGYPVVSRAAEYVAGARDIYSRFSRGEGGIIAVHALDERGAVVQVFGRETDPDAPAIEYGFVSVRQVRDGKVVRIDMFAEDDLHAALEFFAAAPEPAGVRPLENAASRHFDRGRELIRAGDWDAFADGIHPDFVSENTVRLAVMGRRNTKAHYIEGVRAAVDVGFREERRTVVATRGERLALLRLEVGTAEFGHAYDPLVLVELAEDGRTKGHVYLSADDTDAAFARLDERYLDGEAARSAGVWRTVLATVAAANAHDLSAAPFSPALKVLDHRPVSFAGAANAQQLIATSNMLYELAPNVRLRVTEVLRLDDSAAVHRVVQAGATKDGAEFENRFVFWAEVHGGVMTRFELYPESDTRTACERFDASRRVELALENHCTRAVDRLIAGLPSIDPDVFSEDVVLEDRRWSKLAPLARGRRDAVAAIRPFASVRATSEVLATRGERTAMIRRSAYPRGYEVETVRVLTVDPDGRIDSCVVFDADVLDAAYAELDARYLAQLPREQADVWRLHAETVAAYNARDWDRVRALFAEDVRIVDRDGIGLNTLEGADGWTTWMQTGVDLAPTLRMTIRQVHAISASAACTRMHVTDGSVEHLFLSVREIRDGRIASAYRFPADSLDDALARFRELDQPQLDNTATLAGHRLNDAYLSRDWDALEDLITADFEGADRRSLTPLLVASKAQFVETMKLAAALVVEFPSEPLAIRGDLLALARMATRTHDLEPGAPVIEWLSVLEADADGRVRAGVVFDPEELEDAHAELESRYIASLPDDHAASWRLVCDNHAALNTLDWDTFRRLNHDDFRLVDHRPTSVGMLDREAFIGWMHEGANLAPGRRLYAVAVHAIGPRGACYAARSMGRTPDGAEVEFEFQIVVEMDAGRGRRLDFYASDRLDDALARFRELEAPPPLENLATRSARRWGELFAARDWDALQAAITEGHVRDDRRRTLARTPTDAPPEPRVLADIGVRGFRAETIAIRGERLSLAHVTAVGDDRSHDAFASPFLFLAEVNDEGLRTATIVWDPDALDDAIAELDRRYEAQLIPDHAAAWRPVVQHWAAINARDWDAFRAALTDDFVLHDHRPASLPVLGPDEFTSAIRELLVQTADARGMIPIVHAIGDRAACFRLDARGQSPVGAEIEYVFHATHTIRDGRVASIDVFPLDCLDDALACFRALENDLVLENTMVRISRRFRRAFATRDWPALHDLLAPDFATDDRRSGLRLHPGSPDLRREWLEALADLGVTAVHTETLSIRGDRLSLARVMFHGDDPEPGAPIWTFLAIGETDEAGRWLRNVVFDPDDLDGATAELERRYLAQLDGARSSVWRVCVDSIDALNAQDFERFRSLCVEDEVVVDHRPASMGTMGPDELVEFLRAGAALRQSARLSITAVHALGTRAACYTVQSSGVTTAGGDVEWQFVCVRAVQGGLATREEYFPLDRLDDALARFQELEGDSDDRVRIENAATKLFDRIAVAVQDRDIAGFNELTTKLQTWDDRRRGLRTVLEGREALTGLLRVVADWDVARTDVTPVAVRGERLALFHLRRLTDGTESEWLTLCELDDNRELVRVVRFDPDDLDAALHDLRERWHATDRPASEALDVLHAIGGAVRRDGLAASRPFYRDDLVAVDHRMPGLGTPTIDEYHRSREALDDLGEIRQIANKFQAIGRRAVLSQIVWQGTWSDSGPVESPFLGLYAVHDGKLTAAEIFPLDRLDDALARFRDLDS